MRRDSREAARDLRRERAHFLFARRQRRRSLRDSRWECRCGKTVFYEQLPVCIGHVTVDIVPWDGQVHHGVVRDLCRPEEINVRLRMAFVT